MIDFKKKTEERRQYWADITEMAYNAVNIYIRLNGAEQINMVAMHENKIKQYMQLSEHDNGQLYKDGIEISKIFLETIEFL